MLNKLIKDLITELYLEFNLLMTNMSFRSLGKLFKTKKTDKSESKQIILPTEGFEKSIAMLLAYSGQDQTETGSEEREKADSPSHRCNLHSIAVLRFLGRSNGLSGADPFEDLEIDKIVDVFIDFLNKIEILEREQDPELKARNVAAFNEEVALMYLAKLDAVVATNRGHLALSKLTWPDFLLAGMWDHIKEVLEIVANNKFNNIEMLVQQLTSVPAIKLALERMSHNET